MKIQRNWALQACIGMVLVVSASSSSSAGNKTIPKVIYGNDDRLNISQVTDPRLLELAKSTAAMIPLARLSSSPNGVLLSDSTLGEARSLCDEEPFRQELTAANCSGFLVGPDVLITAGHCIQDMSDCQGSNWVFDYTDLNITKPGELVVPQSSVYSCAEVLETVLDSSTQTDYAVVRLDRTVTDRNPLAFRKDGGPSVGDPLLVIGCPSGIPLKVAGGAQVRSNSNPVYLVANLDTYGGNSGSPVFNGVTGEVEGILVRGENDYDSSGRGCMVSYHCTDDGCRGEDVTRITAVRYLNGGVVPTPPAPVEPLPPTPLPIPAPGQEWENSCTYANDGTCDDGRPGARYSLCAYGTDENDCRSLDVGNSCVYANDGTCDDGRPGSRFSLCAYGTDENDCSAENIANSCQYANDGSCDDGRPGAAYSLCVPGTDQNDCGGMLSKKKRR